ncbi:hypothetical protein BD410DRAFT_751899 [Rickenella mellea]|uniref:MYND-type domain-containing protein n=1 Tax=Rickenella mellea TaxID=50990 RepID=A0A4Y7PWE0_9AGAM|nr:hypothetical protein BD410DRAFT_751899 [Rickenella mellea]
MTQDHAPFYEAARLLKKGKSLDGVIQTKTLCFMCKQPAKKPVQCSACKGVKYCGAACAKAEWNNRHVMGGVIRGHKEECAKMKEFMLEAQDVRDILLQFPWGRFESDGRFYLELALAMRNLLGKGQSYGWWTQEDQARAGARVAPLFEQTSGGWGSSLLKPAHLGEKDGWKLPIDEIPWLKFDDVKPPPFPPNFEQNWTSYYGWRGLPLKSPAALLLHWPLTVYRLLYLLGFASPQATADKRRTIVIHYVGAEIELNFLPIFGELTLFFPNTDLELVMFGPRAFELVTTSRPPSLSAKPYPYLYRAPEKCGSGSIRIRLADSGPFWDASCAKTPPDAIVGLNAGMSSYEPWFTVFAASRALSIPFAVTDYTRQSFLEDENSFHMMGLRAVNGTELGQLLGTKGISVMAKALEKPCECALNPFMRPGPKTPLLINLPAGINGFTCVVTPRALPP